MSTQWCFWISRYGIVKYKYPVNIKCENLCDAVWAEWCSVSLYVTYDSCLGALANIFCLSGSRCFISVVNLIRNSVTANHYSHNIRYMRRKKGGSVIWNLRDNAVYHHKTSALRVFTKCIPIRQFYGNISDALCSQINGPSSKIIVYNGCLE